MGEAAGAPPVRKQQFSAIVADLESWLQQTATIIDEHVEVSADLKNDLREMIVCLNAHSFRGCLAMARIVLERILKHFLTRHSIPLASKSMVGQLLGEIEKAEKYVDPSLKNIWGIINAQRIIGVHA
jgi:hypothetical protein